MNEHIIIRVVTRLMIPFIQLFAFYVIAHGELGPGGGFQGGVILGSSFILYILAFGLKATRARLSQRASDFFSPMGVLLFASIGLICMAGGGLYLQYNRLPVTTDPILASQLGIYGIEIGVGITVAAIMVTLFIEMAGRGDD